MPVNFDIEEQDQILEEFVVLDVIKNFMESKLPADISYFNHNKLDELFRQLDSNSQAKPEDYAYALSCIIVNIGNAARQPSSLEKCYKANIRYKRTVEYYFNKYKGKLSEIGKKKLRHSIERQFKHFEFNPVKMALNMIKVSGVPIGRLPVLYIKKALGDSAGRITGGLINAYTGWLAIKYYDLLEAVRVYKRASYAEYDITDVKSVYVVTSMKKESEYFYNIAFAVLEDMLKVYDQL